MEDLLEKWIKLFIFRFRFEFRIFEYKILGEILKYWKNKGEKIETRERKLKESLVKI